MAVQIGAQLGEYRLVRELGTGTFGTVYQAQQVYLGTQVAIKVLHGQITDDERARLRAEARNQAALVHAFIVPVLGYSEQPVPYLVMKFAPNGTLKDRYRLGQRYPLDAILPHVRQVAEGLQHAHNMNLMHLDLKPANILLGEQQEALISDFGIAVILQEFKTHQTMSDFAGTPAYAAPEQIQNKPSKASDQYALATMVYQWLTGTLPFRGDPWSIGVQKLAQNPPSLRSQMPSLPPKVEKVVLRALAKEPGKRFPAVSDFARALEEAALSAAPPPVPPAPRRAPLPAAPAPLPQAPAAPAENIYMAATKISQPLPATNPAIQQPQQTRPAGRGANTTGGGAADAPTLPTPSGMRFPRSVAGRFRRLPKGRRRILLLAALAVMLLPALVAGVVYLSSIRIPFKEVYTLTTTQDATNVARQQINSHLASIEIDHQTQTTPATGGAAPAAQARGTLHLFNELPIPVSFQQGMILTENNSAGSGCVAPIDMVVDATITVPAAPDVNHGINAFVPAHVLQYGAIGNIPGNTKGGPGCFSHYGGYIDPDTYWFAWGDSAFTGGRDAVFQQSDIDRAVAGIMAAHPAPNPTDALQVINNPHSRLLETPAPSCGTRVTADHAVGDKIGEAVVFFTYVCSGYVYDAAGAEQVATNLLTARAAADLPWFFKPDGAITTTITSVTLADTQQATIRLTVIAQGTWVFRL